MHSQARGLTIGDEQSDSRRMAQRETATRTLNVSTRSLDLPARLDLYVDASAGLYACWPFTGTSWVRDYGQISWNGRMRLAHRLAYEVAYGPIPVGLVVRHRCDNPPCCNPIHLSLGTQADNGADCARRGRANPPKGEHHPNVKLTAATVANIRRRVAAGETRTALARKLGVSLSAVSRVVLRKTLGARRMTNHKRIRRANPDDLATYCWCETEIIHVPRQTVLDGQTASCGRPNCTDNQAA